MGITGSHEAYLWHSDVHESNNNHIIYGEMIVRHNTNKATIFLSFINQVFHIKLHFLPVFDTALFSVGGQVLY